MSSLMSQIKGRCTFFFLLLKSKLGSRNENKLDIFKITLPNINFEAFNHQDKVDGGVNGGVNNGLDDWISEIVIKFADSRDADIIQAIGKDPDIKMKELVNISVLKYPKMNSNIISKRIQIHSHLIEFKGAPKAEGYYLKNKINHTHHIHMHLIKGVIASETVNSHAIS